MQRIVVDTNLYIDWLNEGRHEDVLFQRDAVKYLSSVVVLELYAGAFSPRDRRVLRGVIAAFERTLQTRLLRESHRKRGHTLSGGKPIPSGTCSLRARG